jgi:SAM-dependent methyltransferase
MDTDWTDSVSMAYHEKQWEDVKESTKFFLEFIIKKKESKLIVDVGCGLGAATTFIANSFTGTDFIGIDLSPELIFNANKKLEKNILIQNRIKFEVGDLFDLQPFGSVDGVISLQTMSWLSEIETPLSEIFRKLKPNWVCISGLFYEGAISVKTEVFEQIKNRKVFYNTYSLPLVDRFCKKFKYKISDWAKFDMPFTLERSDNIDIMGTYTRKVNDAYGSENLQISGPLLLNWKVVMIEKM